MCLSEKVEFIADHVAAWKAFRVEDKNLYSPINGYRRYRQGAEYKMIECPPFEPEVLLQVSPDIYSWGAENYFFAFENREEAIEHMCYVGTNRIVLPVDLYDVRFRGQMVHPAFMSKRIRVYDSPELRRKFLNTLFEFEENKRGAISDQIKEAQAQRIGLENPTAV